MKILTVVDSLGLGGTERTAQTFAEAYLKLKHESKVLYFNNYNDRESKLVDQGIECLRLLTFENISKILNWNPDLVHIHSHGLSEDNSHDLEFLFDGSRKIVEQNVFSCETFFTKKVNISYQLSNWGNWIFSNRTNGVFKFKSAILPNATDINAFKPAKDLEITKFK